MAAFAIRWLFSSAGAGRRPVPELGFASPNGPEPPRHAPGSRDGPWAAADLGQGDPEPSLTSRLKGVVVPGPFPPPLSEGTRSTRGEGGPGLPPPAPGNDGAAQQFAGATGSKPAQTLWKNKKQKLH